MNNHSHGWNGVEFDHDRHTISEAKLDPNVIGPQLEELYDEASKSAPTTVISPAAAPAGPGDSFIRADQKNLDDAAKSAFKAAVQKLVTDGTYATMVDHHSDMTHNMHGTMGFLGLLRFLAWHRRYLSAFEDALVAADKILRPTAATPMTLPYWHWPDPFPDWLDGFLPATDPSSGSAPPSRSNSAPPEKPDATDINMILTDSGNQLPGVAVNAYIRFTYALEGFGSRPDESSLPAHNHVHGFVGGIMNNTRFSPTDPVFWMHHAEVDRLWQIWQLSNPTEHPPLSGANRVLDPWPETYDDVFDTNSLGYSYDRVTP